MNSTAAELRNPYKIGWYQIGETTDVQRGEIKTYHFFDQDFVAFRADNGELSVLDPYCPHLGAHLGDRGKVIGNQIQCGFHGWQFDTQGKLKQVTYSERFPKKACVKRWHHVEKHGNIYIYYDATGAEPAFDLPDYGTKLGQGWYRHASQIRGKLQPYDILENSVDTAHLVFIHGYKSVPKAELDVAPFSFKSRFAGPFERFRKTWEVEVKTELIGPGISASDINMAFNTFVLGNPTPVNKTESVIFVTSYSNMSGYNLLLRRMIAAYAHKEMVFNIERDVSIFDKRVNPRVAMLTPEDGPIQKYRRWYISLPDAAPHQTIEPLVTANPKKGVAKYSADRNESIVDVDALVRPQRRRNMAV